MGEVAPVPLGWRARPSTAVERGLLTSGTCFSTLPLPGQCPLPGILGIMELDLLDHAQCGRPRLGISPACACPAHMVSTG